MFWESHVLLLGTVLLYGVIVRRLRKIFTEGSSKGSDDLLDRLVLVSLTLGDIAKADFLEDYIDILARLDTMQYPKIYHENIPALRDFCQYIGGPFDPAERILDSIGVPSEKKEMDIALRSWLRTLSNPGAAIEPLIRQKSLSTMKDALLEIKLINVPRSSVSPLPAWEPLVQSCSTPYALKYGVIEVFREMLERLGSNTVQEFTGKVHCLSALLAHALYETEPVRFCFP